MKMIYATAGVSARRNKKIRKIADKYRAELISCIINEDDEGYRTYKFAIEVVNEPATEPMASDLRRCGFEVEVLTEAKHLKNLGCPHRPRCEGRRPADQFIHAPVYSTVMLSAPAGLE